MTRPRQNNIFAIMALPDTMPAPGWVESGAKQIKGLDLLGLRLPVQTIGNSLLDGVTTVTPSIRYFSFRSWIAFSYAQARLPDRWKAFHEYAARVEAAIAVGNLLNDAARGGLLGALEGRKLIASTDDKLPLKPLVTQLGVNIYGGPSEQLGLSFSGGEGVPGLTKERGVALASLMSKAVSDCHLGRVFSSGKSPEWACREQLEEFGRYADITDIPDVEREILTRTLMPRDPYPGEQARLATYAILLSLADALGRMPAEKDLFEAATEVNSGLPSVLKHILDGWLMYSVRDLIACTHEAAMQEISAVLEEQQIEASGFVLAADVIQMLLARVDDHREALRDLRLLKAEESPFDLTFRELHRRIQRAVGRGRDDREGLRRWSGRLNEQEVIEVAFSSGIGALAVLPVAWLLALERAEPRPGFEESPFDVLSYQGWARIGLREVVLPGVTKFLDEDWTLQEVMAELGLRNTDQHLRVSWARLSQDPLRDVAVLSADGDHWSFRSPFYAGRTASRLYQAVGWLAQLRLLNESGLTPSGRSELKMALETLASGGKS